MDAILWSNVVINFACVNTQCIMGFSPAVECTLVIHVIVVHYRID